MSAYLNVTNDLVFKKIFGHPNLLMSFLNSVLPLENNQQITRLEYLPCEQVPALPGLLRRSIVDVKCTDNYQRIFIVEMQILWTTSFTKRMLFNASQAYVLQLNEGENYSSLAPVYALGIVNQSFDHRSKAWYHHYAVVSLKKPKRVLEDFQYIFIELPKFKIESGKHKRLRLLWLRFLREINENTAVPDSELLAQPPIAEAIRLATTAFYSKAELAAYTTALDRRRYEDAIIADFEKKSQENLEKGRAEGEAKGERQAKYVIARNMLSKLGDADIATLTGLSLKEVIALRQQHLSD